MSQILLPALRAGNPIAFLATLGTLRILDGIRPAWRPRIRWANNGEWIPVLSVTGDVSVEQISGVLATNVSGRATAPEFIWADVIAVAPELFHAKAEVAMETASVSQRETVDFLSAFAAEGATSKKGDMKPTDLCMTSGKMQFLKDVRGVAARLGVPKQGQATLAERFEGVLTGSWHYSDDQHSQGWDPTNEPVHALGAYDPSGNGKQTSVRELVYLAAESLSLFPVFARFGKLRTTGFHLDEGQSWFHYPIWEAELSLRSVRSLLQLNELAHPTEKESVLQARGVRAVYRSRRHEFAKGYAIFRPAEAAYGG